MRDLCNVEISRAVPEQDHRYGAHVHLLADPVARTMLARLGSPAVGQPAINRLLGSLYDRLLDAAIAGQLPFTEQTVESRMAVHHPGMTVEGSFLDPGTAVSIAAIGRAGTLPGFRCFERLSEILDPEGVCLDHLLLQRQTDAAGRVIGVEGAGAKIGRPLDDRYLLVTDPMGATGSTMLHALDLYTKEVGGTQRALVALHLIVTPEYIRAVHGRYPQLEIYALRLDRGLSDADVLATVPGTHPERERGLDHRHYIVPGMGGLGELVNNAYV